MGHRSLLITVSCDALTDFHTEPLIFTIAYVDPDIAGKRVIEHNTQLFSGHWCGDDESILPIVTSVAEKIILSIVNAANTSLPDSSHKFRERWGCREGPEGDGSPYACHVTRMFDEKFFCRMGKGGDEIMQPNSCWSLPSWPTSQSHSWCPDTYTWSPQLPSSVEHPPTSRQGYDRRGWEGIG